MEERTSRLADVSALTDIFASSSRIPLELLRNSTAENYLSKLTSFNLDELAVEPTSLRTQSHHLTSSLTSLTHTSYPTFLSLHHTTNALTSSLTSLSSSLDLLLNDSIPKLEDSATSWKHRTESALNERSKARTVLEQHEKIRDFLEIPLLIDACVRNGYFSEALSLIAHAKALATTSGISGHPPPIVSSVLSEVHQSTMQMLATLLSTLYEPNRKLPSLWKAVNFLRKMDIFNPSSPFLSIPAPLKPAGSLSLDCDRSSDFVGVNITSEEQIALAFLLGRESCFVSIVGTSRSDVLRMTRGGELDNREKEDLARYLKKFIDLWREGVYDIITQYSTIFLEKNTLLSSHSPSPIDIGPRESTTSHEEVVRLRTLITTYSSRALTTHLIPVLSPCLPLLSPSLLLSLLTQLTYCSSAFTRLGLDFRGILSLLFSDAVAAVVSCELKAIGDKFVAKFKPTSGPRDLGGDPKTFPKNPSKWLVVPAAANSPPIPNAAASLNSPQPAHVPPQILASYPPLAEHTNAILEVLNNLRLLAPPSILHVLSSVMEEDVLARGGSSLLVFIKSFHSQADASEETSGQDLSVLMATGDVYFAVLVPYTRRALVEGVYGINPDTVTPNSPGSLTAVLQDWYTFKRNVEDTSTDA